jgi:thiosulfate reductase cytochrome b subunit
MIASHQLAPLMAQSAYFPRLTARDSHRVESPRFSAIVRVTHWLTTISFVGLLISGFAILLAHPRLYWGETGVPGGPYVLALPLPTMTGGPSGWGRYLHFLSSWVCILAGWLYVVSGIFGRRFRKDLVPSRADLSWSAISQVIVNHIRRKRPTKEEFRTYNVLQRLTYLIVIFLCFPLLIWTAFAMSPGLVSVFPGLVTSLGGQETARTIHFFVASFVVLFVVVHIVMIGLTGFKTRVWAMISGHVPGGREDA